MGIDKLTCRPGLALPDRDPSALYVVASAHSQCVFRSNRARYSHIPIAELVNLSIPFRGDLSVAILIPDDESGHRIFPSIILILLSVLYY